MRVGDSEYGSKHQHGITESGKAASGAHLMKKPAPAKPTPEPVEIAASLEELDVELAKEADAEPAAVVSSEDSAEPQATVVSSEDSAEPQAT